MKCDEFEAHLDEILDERRRPEWDPQLREHSGCCPRCRDLASAYGVLFEGFRSLKMPELPADLSTRVLESYLARPRLAFSVKASLPAAAAAALLSTAAAVLVAVFLTRGNQSEQVAVVSPPARQATHAIAQTAVGQQSAKQIEQIKFDLAKWKNVPLVGAMFVSAADGDDKTDPYEELAKETGRGLASVVLRMPGVAGPRGVRPLQSTNLQPGGGVWPAQMSEELRPVTESVNETFDLILDTLPVTFWASKSRDS